MDLIIFVTKTYQTDEAVEMIRPMIGKDTVIIPLQNGIDAAERIGRAVGMDHIVGGATWMSAAVEEPGVIGHYSQFGRIAFGELNGKETPRLKPILDAINASGVKVEITEDIQKVLWTKFVFIAPISAMGCLTRVTLGEYRGVPEARKILLAAVSEVTAVGRAGGVALDADVVEKTMAFIDAGAPGIKPSIQRDVEGGKLSELESMIGSVVRLGELQKVPTPVMEMAYAMLKPRELLAQQAAKA
jgi:2-dehydropantoate 2-reductase